MLLNILSAVFVLGVMIIFHELGHFVAAKYFNVRVEAFSVGFGKRIAGFVHDGTDYRLCALPLGGYVKMAGDSMGEGTGDPGEFLSKPRWQRFFIALAGPFFNVILAVALLTGLYCYRYQKFAYEERPALIGFVAEKSAAEKAGLKPGDLLTSVDGLTNPKWEAVELRVLTNGGVAMPVTYERDGQQNSITVTPDAEGRDHVGVAGWAPISPALISGVDTDSPAEKAGIKAGDHITAVNGVPILFSPLLIDLVQKNANKPLHLTVRRGSREFEATAEPYYGTTPEGKKMWRIGVGFQNEVINTKLSLGPAFMASLDSNRLFATTIVDLLGKLLERKVSTRSLSGVVGISKQTGDAFRLGPAAVLTLMAFISINLAIFNLLPIPILDGGVIMLLFIEGTIRRDLSLAMKEKIVTVGFVFLVLFAAYITYMDIIKSLPARFEHLLP